MKMSKGEKAVLHITSDYGYGERGAGGVIPPNADLDFEGEYMQSLHKVMRVADTVYFYPGVHCVVYRHTHSYLAFSYLFCFPPL